MKLNTKIENLPDVRELLLAKGEEELLKLDAPRSLSKKFRRSSKMGKSGLTSGLEPFKECNNKHIKLS